ncbi:hypothetical protein RDV89_02545 [Nocardioides zeae]|uniref:Uncharacterized protein n=1 Tax=Nocardioides imazamoxiresistens TaxID=3231893 RepID=A0ABU3PT16_9ACTN|nr:hypothetical protein [Nocardioides zeae]MDT9591930.1 hypothetical protein [Nocardioides zeae]
MRRLLLLPALALAAPLLVASPASAATVDTFTIAGTTDDIEATVGTTLEVAWDVTAVDPAATVAVTPEGNAVDVVDGWNAAAVAAATDASVDVTIPADAEVGDEYTFQLVVAEDGVAPTVSDVISVYVSETLTVVTPAPVVADDCSFVVPDVEGVSYELVYDYGDGDWYTEPVDAGTYPSTYFSDGEDLVVEAYPLDGYEFPADAVTEFVLPVSEDCFPYFVEAEAVCQGVVVTSVADEAVDVYYGDIEADDVEGQFTLEPGASRTVSTEGELVVVLAGVDFDIDEADEDFLYDVQFVGVEVDQDCAAPAAGGVKRPTHPTVAPAAGI